MSTPKKPQDINYRGLPDNANLRMRDVVILTSLSEATIRRLMKADKFPKPRSYPHTRGMFWTAGELFAWLDESMGVA
ncbi:AlpA family transcriptional regulator [Suttonella sp. R2A3]|uniref:helix-turn-helix transcriptional regulator n=1 Tax=Suttonella sp. R2A3 TaxID=2908648 RepID=UPI001F3BCF75|nr:AlpA family phage regulatory protein [Suttonella sp. R2A3]UJF24770.1 AlpA family transcriptional regulator [Suttonella sp. R2A3]